MYSAAEDYLNKMGSAPGEGADGSGLLGDLNTAYQNYEESTKKILEEAGTDFNTLGETISKVIMGDEESGAEGIVGEIKTLEDKSNDLVETIAKDSKLIGDELFAWSSDVVGYYGNVELAIAKV
jgi:hypothetical protein